MKTILFIQTAIYKISYYLIRLPIYLFSILPLSWLYGIGRGISWILFKVFRYRRQVIAQNLNIVFPEATPQQKTELENQFIHHFADMIAEIVKAFTMRREEFQRRFDIQLSDEMKEEFHNQQDIFICGAHVNNWEWAVVTAGDQLPVRTLSIYKPLSNRAMNQIILDLREKVKTVMIPMGLVLRDILAKDRATSAYIFLSDQSTPFTMTAHWVDFFGLRSPFVPGMSTMAVRYNIPIYYFSIYKVKRGYYKADFSQLVKEPAKYSPEEITAIYSKKLMENILNQPACWLWTHKRWKRVIRY